MDITWYHFLMKRKLFSVVLFCIIHPQTSSGNEYTLTDENLSWTDAIEFCQKNGSQLANLGEAVATLTTDECLERFDTMWTETFASASPYLSLLGCFNNQGNIPHSNLSRASVVDCQFECSSSPYFAISDTTCSCLENVTSSGDRVDPSLCNITCDGTYCGGQDTMNIYYVVDKGFFQNKTVYRNPNFTSCLSYQCLGHRNVYQEADCDDMSISLSDCSNYFSCTFEPGEPCFFYQDDDDDFDWTIQNKATKYGPVQSYGGSYFAFVDDEQYGEGNSTTLVSNVGFTDGQWCIHLRYYIQNVSTDARLEVFKSGEQNPFFIFKKSANKEWKYAYKNIIMSYDERVIFKFTRGKETSDFALDDVIMIKGSCEETVTSMFKMKGEINCNFEGNEDVCFQQNKKGSTWTITRDGSTPTEDTGPSKNIEGNYFLYFAANKFGNRGKAVLSSSFYLEDINITFSMQYSMYGEDIGQLYVYLKDERNTTRDIFKEEGDQREGWKNFTTNITVESKNKLYIEGSKNGSGNKGDIAIDDIKIIIIEPGFQETPTAVQLYSYINNVPTYDWEIYDPRRTRPFVCKRILNSSSDSCVVFRRVTSNHATETTDLNNDLSYISNLVGMVIPIVAGGFTFIICVITGIVCYIRMQKKKKHQNSPTAEAVVYDNSDETFVLETFPSNEASEKKLKYREIPQNAGTESRKRMLENNDIIGTPRLETEYDHLHQKNRPSTSAADIMDNMYSSIQGHQHGTQSLVDDTYDHTIGMESKCGSSQINPSVDDFYDQAQLSENVTSTTDDFYSHVTGDKIESQNMLVDYHMTEQGK
ncbi:uncharacterized protein LOC134242434 [Saccostrea cucullata]|uniref:uncharacterized protein LOC134242434 n=1 Tax=Saccostrea cuccullata TaxID=36930 RepID=UPI002ED1A74E